MRIIDGAQAGAWGINRVTDFEHFSANIGYLNEGHLKSTANWPYAIKRDGIFLMPHFARRLTPNVTTYFEVGPYLTGSTITDADSKSYVKYSLTVMGGFGGSVKLTDTLGASMKWLHVLPGATKTGAADTFLIGVSWMP